MAVERWTLFRSRDFAAGIDIDVDGTVQVAGEAAGIEAPTGMIVGGWIANPTQGTYPLSLRLNGRTINLTDNRALLEVFIPPGQRIRYDLSASAADALNFSFSGA